MPSRRSTTLLSSSCSSAWTASRRRWILRIGVLGGLALILAESGGAFTNFFWPTRVGTFGGKVIAGKPDSFVLNTPTYVREGKFYLSAFNAETERTLAVMPASLGVLPWPAEGGNRVTLADEGELPEPQSIRYAGRGNLTCQASLPSAASRAIRPSVLK